jgi:hypothetical protein
MNRRESKKIAVMAAIIMGLMMFAFMPLASAEVTSFTVNPSEGQVGDVQAYDAFVTTSGVTSIDITIPEGFIAVAPATPGEEIARVDFWNSSIKAYYGHAIIRAGVDPTTQVDIDCEFGGETATTTGIGVDYTAGATNTIKSGFPSDTSSAIIKLPTKTKKGSISITINCAAFQLDAVAITIGEFVKNPQHAGDYTFVADGVESVVTITSPPVPLVYPSAYRNGGWFVDTTGDLIADLTFTYPISSVWPVIPLVGDLGGNAALDTIVFDSATGVWYVDTDNDRYPNDIFVYGAPGNIPVVGDVNQDGTDDVVVYLNSGWWIADTTGNHDADTVFMYGNAGDIPILGDVNDDQLDDRIIVDDTTGVWHADTNMDGITNKDFVYGAVGDKPLVGDLEQNGKDAIVVVDSGGIWHIDTDNDYVSNTDVLYGNEDMTPLAGEIT